LYNALALVESDPLFYHFVGVKWISDQVFKVDKLIFGRLLGITAIDGSLFHRQGNFPSHGFIEVASGDVDSMEKSCDLTDVDQDRVRLLFNTTKSFYRNCDENCLRGCKFLTVRTPGGDVNSEIHQLFDHLKSTFCA
jgi:hypothetical protein